MRRAEKNCGEISERPCLRSRCERGSRVLLHQVRKAQRLKLRSQVCFQASQVTLLRVRVLLLQTAVERRNLLLVQQMIRASVMAARGEIRFSPPMINTQLNNSPKEDDAEFKDA